MNRCRTCSSPRREEIEHDLLASVPIRDIEAKYGVGRMSLQRHQQRGHIAASVVEAVKLRKVAFSENLLDKLLFLQNEALQILREAKESRQSEGLRTALTIALGAIGKAGQLLETQVKLVEGLRKAEFNIQIAIVQDPSWAAVLRLLTDILRNNPVGLRRLVEGLHALNLMPVTAGGNGK